MSLFIGKYYTISEASKYVNADLSTLRRWEYEGRVKPLRTAENQRCYTQPCLTACILIKSDTQRKQNFYG
ncbi:MerR family transcriptional regulator [Streptococcus orisratti]|uniref:MerR family transcriptional regulator n=1 Tax=Streptococcus orisratti TaxID=114652 RepID=UPI003C6F154E